MLNFDVRALDHTTREQLAWAVHELDDFALPHLSRWNYNPCSQHDVVQAWCQACGVLFYTHQRIGIMWLYLRKKALLADIMGSGKTIHGAGLLAMMLETGELPTIGRAIIVPRSTAVGQWYKQLIRMIPSLNAIVAEGTRKQRISQYLSSWDVLVIGPEMLYRDHELLRNFPLALTLADDIDYLRHQTKMANVIDRIGRRSDRYVIMSGTPLQKRLPELYEVLDGVGGDRVFGTLEQFETSYIRSDWVDSLNRQSGTLTKKRTIVGYKNLDQLKQRMAPMVLRRSSFEDLPEVVPQDVYLDLYPAQRRKYEDLQQGVIELMRSDGQTQIKRVQVMAKLHYGAAICAGLAALGEPDGPQTSAKLDWLMEQLTRGDLQDEKVVVYIHLKNTIRALHGRLERAGIGFDTIWGDNKNRAEREAAKSRFWNDPNCRVLIGTEAIEQSLDLQVARHLVNLDMILNPSRMEQLAGRIRRAGSRYTHVFVHNLLTRDTQDARWIPMLEREAALSGYVWDESSDLFSALSPIALAQLITG